jgi:threonine/homoserine/homoserine lactone efflux protein
MLLNFFLGFVIAYVGFIMPSMLNLTVGKIFIDENKKSASRFIYGAAIVVFFQFLLSLYVISIINKIPNILFWIKNSAIVVFLFLSVFYLKKEFFSKEKVRQVCSRKTCFIYGVKLSFVNMFAIPFFALMYSFLNSKEIVSNDYREILFFGIGTSMGVFAVLSSYVFLVKKVEKKVNKVMVFFNPLMSFITAFLAVLTIINLYF